MKSIKVDEKLRIVEIIRCRTRLNTIFYYPKIIASHVVAENYRRVISTWNNTKNIQTTIPKDDVELI